MFTKNIIGHSRQLKLLAEDINTGGIPHAYLFYGPSHIGKFTIAKKMAMYLQCKNDLCLHCPDCVQMQAGTHLDTLVLEDNADEMIKIERVREIIHRTNLTPQSNYFICLIENMERMHREASHAILKTLEEPPGRVIFFLTTRNLKLLLPTIVSRTRMLQFFLVPDDVIEAGYEEVFARKVDFKKVVNFVNGRPGRMFKLLHDQDALERQERIFGEVRKILENRDITERFQFINTIHKDQTEIKRFLTNMLYFLREKIMSGTCDQTTALKYINLIRKTEGIKLYFGHNVNHKLALENLMLEM